MKKYTNPTIEVVELLVEDVMTASTFAIGGFQLGDIEIDFEELF